MACMVNSDVIHDDGWPLAVFARITQLRWETGPVVPHQLQRSLSTREMEFFNAYDRILTTYAQVRL